MAAGLALPAGPALAVSVPVPPAPPRTPTADLERLAARRDSLLAEMDRYHDRIATLHDSLDEGGLDRGDEQDMERAMDEVGAAIGKLGRELRNLELDIGDQRISVRDGNGGHIAIDIPPDLGERLSQGLVGITTAILEELPDSIVIDSEHRTAPRVFSIKPPRQTRILKKAHVRGGDLVRVAEDVYVREDEEVHGNVVAVFGDVLVEGQVTGDVVTVFGDAQVSENALIGGNLVVIGRLEQEPEATVRGDVVVIGGSLLPQDRGGLPGMLRAGWVTFVVGQAGFLVVGLLALLVVGLAPRPRLEVAVATLAAAPAASLGIGIGIVLAGHLVLAILAGILVLTVIGIPLALLLLLAWAGCSAAAIAVTSVQMGRLVLRAGDGGRPWLSAMVGLLLLHLVSFLAALLGLFSPLGAVAVLLGAIGIAIEVFAWVLGLGALTVSRLGRREPDRTPAAAYAAGSETPAQP